MVIQISTTTCLAALKDNKSQRNLINNKAEITIELTGSYQKDFATANTLALLGQKSSTMKSRIKLETSDG